MISSVKIAQFAYTLEPCASELDEAMHLAITV
jgi:hypothetical protein